MGSESEMIPCLDFSMFELGFDQGSEDWKKMSKKVRDACENPGCFILKYDKNKFPESLFENMLMGMKSLFDLPEEIKRKHLSDGRFSGYTSDRPQSENFGIDNIVLGDTALAFTNLMWSQGNPTFSETMKSMSSKMLELSFLIFKMILDDYGLPKQYTSDIEALQSCTKLRLMKYKVPEINKDNEAGLFPHTDKSTFTILCQNEVKGLEVLTKTNKWIDVNIPQGGFVVFVGDILKAWSNGRLHAPTHRVTMCGDKDRYSFGLFAFPKNEVKIEVPQDLVDDKMHPLRYKSFNYDGYMDYFFSTFKEDAIDAYAGV